MVAIVVTRSAPMPSICWGRYVRVSVVDVPYWKAWDKNWRPAVVSTHCRDVLRVIWQSGPCSVGKTARAADQKALAQAQEIAHEWNNAKDMATAEQIIGAGGSA